jgi:hypothetical protein
MRFLAAQLTEPSCWSQNDPTDFEREPAVELHSNLDLPLNFAVWFSPWILAGWVQEEVGRLDLDQNDQHSTGQKCNSGDRDALLALLSFSYLIGVFDGEGILRESLQGAGVSLLTSQPPGLLELVCFRRRHRGLLVTLLGRLIVRAIREKLNLRANVLPLWVKRRVHEQAVERLDIARHLDNCD